jgi:hypothetical protein
MGKHEVDNRPWCDHCGERVVRVFGFELAFDWVNVCWVCFRQYEAGVFK